MFSLLIRKTFYNYWDNFFPFLIINAAFVLLTGTPLFLLLGTGSLKLGAAAVTVTLFLGAFLFGSIGPAGYEIARHRSWSLSRLPQDLVRSIKSKLLLGLLWLIEGVSLLLIIPFYFSTGNLFGFALGVFFAWGMLFLGIALQFYLPLLHWQENTPLQALKKSFFIMFANPGPALGLFFGSLMIAVLSFFTLFMFLGPAALLLWQTNGTYYLLLRHQHIEAGEGAVEKPFPWRQVLEEESETVGRRSLKNLIFPWKD